MARLKAVMEKRSSFGLSHLSWQALITKRHLVSGELVQYSPVLHRHHLLASTTGQLPSRLHHQQSSMKTSAFSTRPLPAMGLCCSRTSHTMSVQGLVGISLPRLDQLQPCPSITQLPHHIPIFNTPIANTSSIGVLQPLPTLHHPSHTGIQLSASCRICLTAWTSPHHLGVQLATRAPLPLLVRPPHGVLEEATVVVVVAGEDLRAEIIAVGWMVGWPPWTPSLHWRRPSLTTMWHPRSILETVLQDSTLSLGWMMELAAMITFFLFRLVFF